jgi:hypothetical protein
VLVADNLSDFTLPTFSSDGSRFVYVEYFCCGLSNGAYLVEVQGDTLGAPTLIHEPLASGARVTDAAISPNGEHLLARFDADGGAWKTRPVVSAVDAWVPLTAGTPWGPSAVEPRFSPDGSAAFLVEGENGVQRAYVVDLTGPTALATLVFETLNASHPIYDAEWHPDGRGIVFEAGGALHWVPTASPLATQVITGPGEFVPVTALAYSPSGDQLLYVVQDDPDVSLARSIIVSRELVGDVLGEPEERYAATGAGKVYRVDWATDDAVLVYGDLIAAGQYDLFLLDGSNTLESIVSDLPNGATVADYLIVDDGVAVAAQGLGTNVLFRPYEGTTTSLTNYTDETGFAQLFARLPDGSAFACTRSSFSPQFETVDFTLTQFGPAAVDVVGPLPQTAYLSNSGLTWSSDGRRVAFSGDRDADGLSEVIHAELVGSVLSEIETAIVFDDGDSYPGNFVWQP